LEQFPNISYLAKLEFLDLSNNLLQDLDPHNIPKQLVVLKLQGNPFTQRDPDNKYEYRKPFVLHLQDLDKLDKISIMPVERLSYQGMMPKVNIQRVLKETE